MSLKLRRGTDAERAAVVFNAGELVYTTDTKQLWVGDASTPGGILISSDQVPAELVQNLDLNSNDIVGTGNITISGTVQADQFIGDVAGSIVGDISGSVFADDSTIIVNGQTGVVTASLVGDVNGSVFGDDSTVLVDSVNNKIYGQSVNADDGGFFSNAIDKIAKLNFTKFSASDLDGDGGSYGKIDFLRNDSNGEKLLAEIWGGGNGYIILNADSTGLPSAGGVNKAVILLDGKLGIGTFTPSHELDVQGDVVATGTIAPGTYADVAARDVAHASPTNGEMIYLTSTHKFQGYANGGWVDLN
jgi:hypothetical protein